MAKKEASLLLRIKQLGAEKLDQVNSKIKGLKDSTVNLAKKYSALLGPAALATAAIGAIGAAAAKLALSASEFKSVEASFKNMANSQGEDADMMLQKMRQLSAGTVDDLELMKQANQAMLLGLPVDKFGDMLKIARSSAKATGQSMEFMLQSIVTGLGRGCVAGDTIINLEDNEIKIEDAYKKNLINKILGLNKSSNGLDFLNFSHITYSGIKECILLKTKKHNITLTPDHFIFTKEKKWVEAKDALGLSIGSKSHNKLLYYEPIISIEDVGKLKTYDPVGSETRSFIGNSLIISNSKLMLDNLGIMIDTNKAYENFAQANNKLAKNLTEAEKKQAFINEALRIGKENADKAGSGTIDLKDKWEQLKTEGSNLLVVIGEKLLPVFNKFADVAITVSRAITGLSSSQKKAARTSVQISKELEEAKIKLQEMEQSANRAGGGFLGMSAAAETSVIKQKQLIEELKLALQEQEAEEQRIADAKTERDLLKREEERSAIEEQNTIKYELRLQALEAEIALINTTDQQKLSNQLKTNAKEIKNEQNRQKKLKLLRDREILLEKQKQINIQNSEKLTQEQRSKSEMAFLQARVNILSSTARLATAIMGRESKAAFAIQKAAALAQAYVSMNLAMAQALAVPPAPNFALQRLAKSAGLINIAAIGAQAITGLAEGGIVKATPGGMPAIIGEGERDEAVIPLDDEGAAGIGQTNITINVNGGLLGDEEQAREFALAVDNELFKLRKSEESIAFDTGII